MKVKNQIKFAYINNLEKIRKNLNITYIISLN